MIKTILFDLDDTIFDYKYSRRCALEALRERHILIAKINIDELEKEHEKILIGNYPKLLDKRLTLKESILERTYLLFKRYGINLTNDEVIEYTDIYKEAYESNRRAIPRVKELLKQLKKSMNIGIVSNGLAEIQIEKIKICGIEDLIDFMIISEEVGTRKPEKAIFEAALIKSNSKPEETIFIGDSWESDIIGASNCGIKTIWLNRYHQECPDGNFALEIQSYENMDVVLDYINDLNGGCFPFGLG